MSDRFAQMARMVEHALALAGRPWSKWLVVVQRDGATGNVFVGERGAEVADMRAQAAAMTGDEHTEAACLLGILDGVMASHPDLVPVVYDSDIVEPDDATGTCLAFVDMARHAMVRHEDIWMPTVNASGGVA